MKRIIVTRFSAMGDVAMVASVLQELQAQQPDLEIIMVSRKLFKAFFDGIPRLRFHELDPHGKHKGVKGLFALFQELSAYKPHYVADLHNNLRSRTLDFFFKLWGFKTAILFKGRKEKEQFLKQRSRRKIPLKPTTERYADVFRKLGFHLTLAHKLHKAERPLPALYQHFFTNDSKKIGIAPFAQHSYKIFPLEKMEAVVANLSAQRFNIFIFGGGQQEKDIVDKWCAKYKNVVNTIGTIPLQQELDLIANLDLMVSMDSSGMHMASLVGIRCLSIWGATHPYTGFLGYGQSFDDCIQVDHPNRPSSIYGNKPCLCDGVEAIDLVTPEMVIDKILSSR
ncbi:glycosyltransferase family 9 protein [Sphingobacterium sp. Mn56C]|uniref:glycosyltransferase family 9 protein n=1 Tax=Sphingobacterium sp. Mn56C TaxID=3395261 RepID=UPI003BE9D96F